MQRILLVEDDEMMRQTLRVILGRAGHEVVDATNGREALECLSRENIDLVITDIMMPEMDGIETIISLKRASPTLKLLAISGGGSTGNFEFLEMARKFGAAETLRKPFKPKELLDAVERVLAAGVGRA